MTDMLERAQIETEKLRIALCRDCKSQHDLIAVASAFLSEASNIHVKLSGNEIAAKIFQSAADRLREKEPST